MTWSARCLVSSAGEGNTEMEWFASSSLRSKEYQIQFGGVSLRWKACNSFHFSCSLIPGLIVRRMDHVRARIISNHHAHEYSCETQLFSNTTRFRTACNEVDMGMFAGAREIVR